MKIILLGTAGCHLCEQAENILATLKASFPKFNLELIDIAEDLQWQAAYATKIPVLYHANSRSELKWPFNEPTIINFINNLNNDNKL